MKKKPKLSVIIPVFNQEKYLGRCLRSLIDQSLKRTDYEIIVVEQCDSRPINKAKLMNIGFNIMKQKTGYFSPNIIRKIHCI